MAGFELCEARSFMRGALVCNRLRAALPIPAYVLL
jgi:hypothetical protein